MIIVDVNLLIYAYDTTCPAHNQARAWLESVLSGDEIVGLPWQSVSAFLRILTYPEISRDRFSMQRAVAIVDQWLTLSHVRMLSPGEGHWAVFRGMLVEGGVRGRLTGDAALAALAIEHGGILYTNDRDFARFPGLRWVNPLQKS